MFNRGDLAISSSSVIAFEFDSKSGGFYLCDIYVSKDDVVVVVGSENYAGDVAAFFKAAGEEQTVFCKILTKSGIAWLYNFELRKIL